ncbi:MAG: sulfatase-like hydrolase/transferase [Planctomycetota bacterium]
MHDTLEFREDLDLLVMLYRVCAIVLLGLSVAAAPQARATQPNVVVIMIDDAGYGDVGFQGAEFPTPNLDSIAANGVQFTNAHVTAPQCGPSRAGFITGMNQARFGFHDNAGNVGLPPTERVASIGAQMQDQGYTTGVIGKWHAELDKNTSIALTAEEISRNERSTPWRHGFDYTLIHDRGQTHYFPYSAEGQAWMDVRNREHRLTEVVEGTSTPVLRDDFAGDAYVTDIFTQQAIDYIDRRQDETDPFFLFLSYNAPHTPLQSLADDLAAVPASITDPERRQVAAMMAAADRGVGEIQAKLAAEGIADDTMIVFISDNGGPLNPGGAYDNGGFRGYKGDMYEGGTRVPMAIQWTNGNITGGGQVIDDVVSAMDILPTVVAAVGGQVDPTTDGVDLLPYLQGATGTYPRDDLLIQWRSATSYRIGDDKLVDFNATIPANANNPEELFNLATDPFETTVVNNPVLQAQLQAQIDDFTTNQRDSISVTPVQVGAGEAGVYYGFDELAGPVVADGGFNSIATDLSLPGSGVDPSVPGVRGSAMALDGTTGVSLDGDLDEWKPAGDFTTTFWVNLASHPDVQNRLIDSTNNNGAISGSSGWRLLVDNGSPAGALKVQLQANDGTPGGEINATFSSLRDLTIGEWAFVALRYDADGDASLTLLYDTDTADVATLAQETQSVAAIGNLPYGPNATPRLGAAQDGLSKFLDGSFDELYLYDWALSDEQLLRAFMLDLAPPGDANLDGVVDLLDFDVLAQRFAGSAVHGAVQADHNGDGTVGLLDFDILAQNFGGASPGTVPEPASAALLGLASVALRRRPMGGRSR